MTSIISSKSLVPVGAVIALLTAFAATSIQWHQWTVEDRLWKARVEYDLQQIADRSSDRWSRRDQQAWRDRLDDLNRGSGFLVPPLPGATVMLRRVESDIERTP